MFVKRLLYNNNELRLTIRYYRYKKFMKSKYL